MRKLGSLFAISVAFMTLLVGARSSAQQAVAGSIATTERQTAGRVDGDIATARPGQQSVQGILAWSPRFIYIANHDSNDVSAFAIDAATGLLSPVAGSPFASESGPDAVVASPDGRYLFVANEGSSSVSSYRIGTNGALTMVGESAQAAGARPAKLAMDPTGRFLFSTNRLDASISAFTIDEQSGSLHALKQSPLAIAGTPSGIAVSPNGRFVYVGDASGGKISIYTIDQSKGMLQETESARVDAHAESLAISASGDRLYAASGNAHSVTVFQLDPEKGEVSPTAISQLTDLNAPGDLVLGTNQDSLYLGGSLQQSLSKIAVSPSSGELTLTSHENAASEGALFLAVEPTAKYIYAVSPTADSVTRFLVDARTSEPLLESGVAYATGSAPNALAVVSALQPNTTGTIGVTLANSNLLTYSGTTGSVHIEPAASNTGGSSCAGQIVQLAFSVPSIAVISTSAQNPATSVCVLTGQKDAAFTVTTAANSGSATLTGFATGFTNGTVSVGVSLRSLSIALPFTNIAVGHSISGTVTLANPAPAGGVHVALATNASQTATISPSSVTIASGSTTASFTATGVAVNTATLSASVAAGGYGTSSITVSVLPAGKAINLPHGLTVAPGQSLPYPISIGAAASSAVSISFATSGGPGTATISPNPVIIPAGATAPTTQPTIKGGALGALNVTGNASGYASDIQSVNVSITLTFSPSSQSVQIGHSSVLTLSASSIAPAGGFVINTSTLDTSKATVPATVTIPPGSSTALVTITGVAAGTTTLKATAAGAVAASAAITVNATPGITLFSNINGSPSFTLGKNGVTGLSGYIAVAAPAGNLNVTMTSTNSSALLLSTTVGGAGSSSIVVQVAAGSTSIPTFYAQALSASGTAAITATATGYSSGSATASFVPSGFIVQSDTNTTTFAAPSPVYVTFVQLDPSTLNYAASLTLRAGAPAVAVALKNSATSVGTLGASTITFNHGDSQKQTTFTPVAAGSATISFNSTPSGYSAATNYTTAVYTVTTPNSGFSSCYGNAYTTYAISMGKNSQACGFAPLLAAPAPTGGKTVTLTVSDSSKLKLSTSPTAVGLPSITVSVPAGTQYGAAFYVQALSLQGTVTVTETVPGFNPSTLTITLNPSGFIVQGGTSTTTFSTPSPVYVTFVQLDPTTRNYVTTLTMRPGVPATTVALKNSNTAVGTLASSSVVFNPGDSQKQTTFAPTGTAAGTSTISFDGTPTNYFPPSDYNTTVFTVSAPSSGFSSCYGNAYTTYGITMGKNSQACGFAPLLAAAAPTGGRTATLTVSDSSKLRLSTSPTTVGLASISVNIAAGSQYGSAFYVQALSLQGTVTVTETVPGFSPSTLTITLNPSGFIVQGGTSTTTFSTPSPVYVTFVQLDPTTRNYVAGLTMRPGVPATTVALKNSNTAVGTLGSSAIVFNPGDSQKQTTFAPTGNAAGTSTISFDGTPTNYFPPSNYNTTVFTVSAPSSGFTSCFGTAYTTYAISQGKNALSCAFAPVLAAAAPAGRTVTLTSGNSGKVLLSSSPTSVGSASLSLTVPAGSQYGPDFYLQALSDTGTVTVTETIPGFNPATLTLTLTPSGFIVQGGTATTTFASASTVSVTFSQLDPTTLNYAATASLRPGLAGVVVNLKNSTTSVGTLGATSITFSPGDSSHTTTFTPIANGTATISLNGKPSNFSMPSNYQSTIFTVTAPSSGFTSCYGSAYTSYAVTYGKNSQSCAFAPVLAAPAPSGGRTITLTSSSSSKLLISANPTAVGTGSLTLSAAAGSQYGSTFYLQTLTDTGTATITQTIPGYNPATLTVTFSPSGFIVQSDTTTTTFSAASPVYVTFVQLDASTRDYVQGLSLRPGIAATSVGLSNSNTSVGHLGSSSIVFSSGNSQLQTTYTPTGTAAGVSTIAFSSTPSGFSTPANYKTAVYTVTAPAINVVAVTVGKNLQTTTYAVLAQPVPSGGRTITVTSSDSSKFLLSATGTTTGTGTLTFNMAAGQQYTPTFYIQALTGTGTATATVSATGYANGAGAITLYPSGFALQASDFTTHLSDNPTTLTVVPAALDPMYHNVYQVQQLRPNQPNTKATLTMTDQSGTSPVGQITLNPVAFQGDDSPNAETTSFRPLHVGTTLIKVTSPSGFTNASSEATATVIP